jgi:small subunit ribosomal protein S1
MAERKLDKDRNGVPPPMDDGWWDSVLEEQDRLATGTERGRGGSVREREGAVAAPEDWIWARELYEADDTVQLRVVGFNRGGALVEARSLRGFVPVSHLVSLELEGGAAPRAEALAALIGQELDLKVIEFDPERGRLIFSERAAQSAPGKRIEVMASLKPGDQVAGKATNITRFGVFVDLGGVEGLIHVSELSWGRVRHPSDVAQVGDTLRVQVLSVDAEQGRIALSLKELQPDPWATVEGRFKVGDIVKGTVTNVVKFGAFVGVEPGLEGLIHVSELGDGPLLRPGDVVSEGQSVTARVVHIDAADRKLGLSLRGVPQRSALSDTIDRQQQVTEQNGRMEPEHDPEQEIQAGGEHQASIGTWHNSPAT